MIEINLLPEELKAKARSKKTAVGAGAKAPAIDIKYIIYLLPLLFGILLCAHIYLLAIAINKNSQLRQLNSKWQALAGQRKALDDFNKEYAVFSEDAKAVQQLNEQRIAWAGKLNKLSSLLPAGVWFRELSVSPAEFNLQGSALSLRNDGMDLIKKFIDDLKNDPEFSGDFKDLELGSVQRKALGSYDTEEFTLAGKLKSK